MRILALDVGSRRIGLAISDALGITAQGLPTLDRMKDKDVVESLRKIIQEQDVGEVVVGLPLNMDGSHGPKARETASFAECLKTELGVAVKLWDERMSTQEVERLMIEGDVSRGKRRKRIDKLAAQVILQSYLNAQKRR